jgi:hypothetical protein
MIQQTVPTAVNLKQREIRVRANREENALECVSAQIRRHLTQPSDQIPADQEQEADDTRCSRRRAATSAPSVGDLHFNQNVEPEEPALAE